MLSQYEIDIIVKGIEISWTTWGKMAGEKLVIGDISYLKSETEKGFERIFDINIEENQNYRIQQMIAFIKAGILPDSMLITPRTKPENLHEILSEKGFIINDSDPCMMMYIDEYKPNIPENHELIIKKVTEKSGLPDWLNIINKALFEGELVSAEQFYDVLKLENTQFYIGIVNNKAVTACMTITEGDTSVLEMVATLKEYRKNGYAAALIDTAIKDLSQNGIKTISLRAEADGVNVYKHLGFKECFNRIVAGCDWKNVHKKACPCKIEDNKIQKAKQLFEKSSSIKDFILEMEKQRVIGRNISYNPDDNAIYITKMYACDCDGGYPSSNTVIGQRCHCEYVNHLDKSIPISYCKCAATFFEPMFTPLFGENIEISAIQTVLSGGESCIFKIKL